MNSNFESILNQLKKWEKVSTKTLNNGTVLICNVPHIAPQAWLHEIYAVLGDEDIEGLESALGRTLPADYVEFLKCANGINIFSDSLSIWGKRNLYTRKGEDAILPYDLISLNEEKVRYIPRDWVVFGSYSWDGSIMVYDLKKDFKKVARCSLDSNEVLHEWPSLWSWIKLEVERLSNLFDDNGVEFDENTPTVPEL